MGGGCLRCCGCPHAQPGSCGWAPGGATRRGRLLDDEETADYGGAAGVAGCEDAVTGRRGGCAGLASSSDLLTVAAITAIPILTFRRQWHTLTEEKRHCCPTRYAVLWSTPRRTPAADDRDTSGTQHPAAVGTSGGHERPSARTTAPLSAVGLARCSDFRTGAALASIDRGRDVAPIADPAMLLAHG